jgi:ABC-type sugar transport system ATPase subunit
MGSSGVGGDAIVEARGVSRQYPGVLALDRVNFVLLRGEVHALVGENGAGKSTLMKILAGAEQPDSGSVFIDGAPVVLSSTQHALRLGVTTIYQELNLIATMSVVENIFLGDEIRLPRTPFISGRRQRARAAKLLRTLGAEIDPDALVGDLGVGQQQIVEIAKALHRQSRVLIMDEPTAALGLAEIAELHRVVRELRRQGVSIIYVSHRLNEIFAIADRVTVLRDGRVVGTHVIGDITTSTLVQEIVGERPIRAISRLEVEQERTERPMTQALPLLEVKNLSRPPRFDDISFHVWPGEIYGLAGLLGSGRTEILRSIFGADSRSRGEVFVGGRLVRPHSPQAAVRAGMAFLTEDRKAEGLVLDMSVRENVTLPLLGLGRATRLGVIRRNEERAIARRQVTNLRVRCRSLEQPVVELSGGNQQKVVLARWLELRPRVVLLDEPTRGIDVGAKAEIYELITALARQGVCIVLVSSELQEILTLAHRIGVVRQGRLVTEITATLATEELILREASGMEATTA